MTDPMEFPEEEKKQEQEEKEKEAAESDLSECTCEGSDNSDSEGEKQSSDEGLEASTSQVCRNQEIAWSLISLLKVS